MINILYNKNKLYKVKVAAQTMVPNNVTRAR